MKRIIAGFMVMFAATVFATETVPVKTPAPAQTLNCVSKDKKGECPPAPKSKKPTPKKKADAPKAAASAPAPAVKASEPAKK